MRSPFAVVIRPDLPVNNWRQYIIPLIQSLLTQHEHILAELSIGFGEFLDDSVRQRTLALHDVTFEWCLEMRISAWKAVAL